MSSHLSEGDVWTIAETHFFGKDVSKFRASLKATKTDHRYFVPDQTSFKPCLTNQAAWKGVAVLSKHPTRPVPVGLPTCIQNSGRALLTTTLLSDTWISGGVIYGEPDGHRYPNHLRNTEFLLHHVASHVCHLSSGLRFVSGDWNVEQDSLPAFDILTRCGFRDVQDLALERWGHPIQVTCKNRARKDFLYISPKLQELMCGVETLPDVWPDHSVLMAKFRSPASLSQIFSWPVPSAFPWPSLFGSACSWDPSEDPTVAYQQLWQQSESSAAQCCPFAVALGRAQRLQRKQCKPGQVNFQPEFFGGSQRHAQWVRQVRRLQAFPRLCASVSPHTDIQRAETWGAVIRASGFRPSFAAWWEISPFRATGPMCPPDGSIAWTMFDSMVQATRDLESSFAKHSRQARIPILLLLMCVLRLVEGLTFCCNLSGLRLRI